MKILFFGAGVIGSVFAARIAMSGHEVTVLDREDRLEEIKEYGIIIENGITGKRDTARVKTVNHLGPEDYYDLAVVPVRSDHLPAILPVLAANRVIPDILIMVNNPKGPHAIIDALGPKRFLLGFPGRGGGRKGPVVIYEISKPVIQRTTVGELGGKMSKRVKRISALIKGAGFPVTIESNMDAWQKTHVCWVSPFANAIYMAGGTNYQLAQRLDIIRLFLRATQEGFSALKHMKVPVTPWKFRFLNWLPELLLVKVFQRVCSSKEIEILATLHCQNAPNEMKELAQDLRTMVEATPVSAPAMELLAGYIPDI
ncbi:MAG: ketopantoate reductase family protein [Chitinophagales bacterium]